MSLTETVRCEEALEVGLHLLHEVLPQEVGVLLLVLLLRRRLLLAAAATTTATAVATPTPPRCVIPGSN